MKAIERIIDKAHLDRKRVVLSEAEDPRVLAAARMAIDKQLAHITLVGDEPAIIAAAELHHIDLVGIHIVSPQASSLKEVLAERLYTLRKAKGMTHDDALELVLDPLVFANLMVREGLVDGTVNGAVYTTSDVVRAALQIIGPAPDSELVSSFFLMMLCEPFHNLKGGMIFSDCGLVINPNETELASIAVAASNSAQTLLMEEPKVAMLSFSTNGSAKHESVDKVRNAAQLVKQRCPGIAVDQDVQLDAAIVTEIAAKKLPDSEVKGQSNVLIFPNLEAGNIGYKLAERLGGAVAIGPLLQGLNQPANDLSRGCSAQDIFNVIAVTAVQAQQGKVSDSNADIDIDIESDVEEREESTFDFRY
ncbi:phosphate acetyltransferase [Vibrio splendidus]|uniref:Phosphate acetyltransferase n=1 Tax=Vibrio splendidus TaxID=29497 RepID=A0A7Y4FZF6_VIBSP|nr:phosphate acetyltransferase [Vibrio splendidus]KPL96064.1 phosphate acetyltransferase [Vibrio splendidus]NOJ12632.1 phosphate acetyltransferase [Vibrio splendidus]